MKLLITAFEPFGGNTINPSLLALHELNNMIDGADIIKLEIPVEAYTSLDRIHEVVKLYDPDVIVSLGQAQGRADISVERIGINVNDYRIADNAGNQPVNQPIYKEGPAAYFSTLPIYAMVRAIRKAGIAASISNTAGTYVCNHVLYGVSHMLAQEYPKKRSGFLHVPSLPSQTTCPSKDACMELCDIVTGIEAALHAIVRGDCDDAESEGTLE